jgi:hypothetical protein
MVYRPTITDEWLAMYKSEPSIAASRQSPRPFDLRIVSLGILHEALPMLIRRKSP